MFQLRNSDNRPSDNILSFFFEKVVPKICSKRTFHLLKYISTSGNQTIECISGMNLTDSWLTLLLEVSESYDETSYLIRIGRRG